jgi:hypothetical protein
VISASKRGDPKKKFNEYEANMPNPSLAEKEKVTSARKQTSAIGNKTDQAAKDSKTSAKTKDPKAASAKAKDGTKVAGYY